MEKTNLDLSGLGNSLKSITKAYMDTLSATMENVNSNMGSMQNVFGKISLPTLSIPGAKTKSNCCPPEPECPPHCILQITRHAFANESIIVPFAVKNNCNGPRTYRVGVRELKNQDGTLALFQPLLSKQSVTLAKGESQMVLMSVELKKFSPGTYTAEIVIREKDINQNICFTLVVDSYSNVPVAEPMDEKKYRMKWQSWQRHYYCEPQKRSEYTHDNTGNK